MGSARRVVIRRLTEERDLCARCGMIAAVPTTEAEFAALAELVR